MAWISEVAGALLLGHMERLRRYARNYSFLSASVTHPTPPDQGKLIPYPLIAQQSSLPSLSETQAFKLRQLSLLSIFSSPPPASSQPSNPPQPSNLEYQYLLTQLSLPTTRALESLLVASISASLISGTLNPLSQRADISSVAPLRDLPPNSLPTLVSSFEAWEARCGSVLSELEARVQEVKKEARGKAEKQRFYDGVREELIEVVEGPEKDKGKGKGDGGGAAAGREKKRGVSGAGEGKEGRKRGGLFGRR